MIVKEEQNDSSKKNSKRHNKRRMANPKEKKYCPLCVEMLELDDLYFFPCICEYQVCRFCWHTIKMHENSCPHCRRQYPDDPANYKPLTAEELIKIKTERKLKEKQKKKEVIENRNLLASKRILQKNLVYVQGLPSGIDSDNKKLLSLLSHFGPLHRCIVNNKTNYAGSQSQRATAYVTYQRVEDALKACKYLPQQQIDGFTIKASLGTTKYCSNFLKNAACSKKDCMYLHENADEELCFTKEQIQASEHVKYADILYKRMLAGNLSHKTTKSSPVKGSPPPEEKKHEITVPSSPTSSTSNTERIILPKDELVFTNTEENGNSQPLVQSKLQHMFSTKSEFSNELVQDHKDPPPYRSDVKIGDFLGDWIPQVVDIRTTFASNNRTTERSLSPPAPHEPVEEPPQQQQNRTRESQNFNPMDSQSFLNSEHVLGNHRNTVLKKLADKKTDTNGLSDDPFSSFHRPSFEPTEAELDFDPCQFSLDNLSQMVMALDQDTPPPPPPPRARMISPLNHRTPVPSSAVLHQHQQRMIRARNPPPGFTSSNDFLNRQQQMASPSLFDIRNSQPPSKLSPVLPTVAHPPPLTFSSLRAAAANNTPRIQNFPSAAAIGLPPSLSNNNVPNTFATQHSMHTMGPSLFHNATLSQSTPNMQPMQSQRCESLATQQPFSTIEQQNMPLHLWNNVNQGQWLQGQSEGFQSHNILDGQPASPRLINNFNRLNFKPLEGANHLSQQQHPGAAPNIALRFGTSAFSDNPPQIQYSNQVTKGVHTYP